MRWSKLSRVVATARPPFLLLTPCCLSPAWAFAFSQDLTISYLESALILVGGLAAHISVNMFNEYQDFISGLDSHTQRTAFSGGSGTLQQFPELSTAAFNGAILSVAIVSMVGVYFIWLRDWNILLPGLLGILLVIGYSTEITRIPWLSLIAPGLGFGPVMVNTAYYALSGRYGFDIFLSSMVVFFLVNNLLLLNQFPDVEADRTVGRRNAPILLGREKSAGIFLAFLATAYLIELLAVTWSLLPTMSLLSLCTLPLAVFACTIVLRHTNDMDKIAPALALNIAVTLLTPLLISVGVVLR
jgi:1,4-dihydroxy-2-naphthoate octaprenyltransferase